MSCRYRSIAVRQIESLFCNELVVIASDHFESGQVLLTQQGTDQGNRFVTLLGQRQCLIFILQTG